MNPFCNGIHYKEEQNYILLNSCPFPGHNARSKPYHVNQAEYLQFIIKPQNRYCVISRREPPAADFLYARGAVPVIFLNE